MLGSYSMNFILLYLISGFTTAFITVYILKWHFIGFTYGAILIGILGSFLGSLMGTILLHNGISLINTLISFVFSFISLTIFHAVSKNHPD